MSARWITADVFDGLAQLDDGSVDLVVTSPPFLALRSYLPVDHPDKGKEIGSEATPAEFIDTLLAVTAELRRVLAPHGSIAIELGDTYAGSGGAGGDYNDGSLRDGQPKFDGSAKYARHEGRDKWEAAHPINRVSGTRGAPGGQGWPLAKSRTLIPQLYEIALAYGINPLTGQPSPAGQWRIRNVVTWARPNPPVGALGDKWRPATSDLIVACTSSKRYWDDLATRKPFSEATLQRSLSNAPGHIGVRQADGAPRNDEPVMEIKHQMTHAGAPLLDYWEIPPGGYKGAHYAVFPPALVEPLVKAMCPQKVCRTCGEPSRRIVEGDRGAQWDKPTRPSDVAAFKTGGPWSGGTVETNYRTIGWSDCGHNDYRPGLVLDPFAGSGTTLVVATGHGHDAIGIDLDERNLELSRGRVGPFFFEEVSQ